jgi:hypothetical protein
MRASRRARNSAASNASMEIAIDIAVRRRAPASPPGTYFGRVMTRKTQTGPAPRVAAAPSSRRSTASIQLQILNLS